MTDLVVTGLTVRLRNANIKVVDDVSFSVRGGRTLALVGESGSGKSITALSILGLMPDAVIVERGSARLTPRSKGLGTKGSGDDDDDDDGEIDLLAITEGRRRRQRGRRIAMIFQEPMTALNPLLRVDDQVGEALRIHRGLGRSAARKEAARLLDDVGVPTARANSYPHELSGGQRQRVMIAAALAAEPDILLADEPTTALDVTVQAQILTLLRGLVQERGLGLLLITHDLGVVATACDDVAVMYGGQLVEFATVDDFFAGPQHPYGAALLASMPSRAVRGQPLPTIPGVVPPAELWPDGCRFRDRCPEAVDACQARPTLTQLPSSSSSSTSTSSSSSNAGSESAHWVACFQRPAGSP